MAEDHGLSMGLTGGHDEFCDTKLPTHVDDRDLSTTMGSMPTPQAQWTEMTHFLVASEMYQALQQFNRLSMSGGDDKMASLDRLLSTTKARIDQQYLQYCDINIPIQKCSLLLGRLLIGKFEVLVRQQYLRGLSAEESAAQATEETLTLACNTIEVGIEMKTDELLNNFQWLFSTFVDYHLLTYALWHICVRPEALGADRAWTVVNSLFVLADTQGWPTPGSKWNVLRKLREKANEIRQSFQANVAAAAAVDMHHEQQQADQATFDISTAVPMFADGITWDFDSLCFPDWGGFASSSNIHHCL